MGVKYAMVIDSSRCFDCRVCIVSCQLENKVPPGRHRNWIKNAVVDEGAKVHYQPGNCMHCDSPTCVEACPTSATYKDKTDGIVKVNTGLCIGCGSCIPACPYGARFKHPVSKVVDKCDYCVNRRAQGKPPACVDTCPTQARIFGDLLDPNSLPARLLKEKKTVRIINQKTDTDPKIYYIDRTAPMDWPVEAKTPTPIQLWMNIADPLMKGLVGITGLGVLVMLGKQLLLKDETPASGDEQEKDDAHGQQND
jgi:tetrathionate reductase subunit B